MSRKCPTPEKRAYHRRERADKAIARLGGKPGHGEAVAYRCVCGFWHLASDRSGR